tara:strand:+ start:5530 stop:5784 length:255 start_codon:yes stop_codon:yes gene_type:complete
MSLIEIQEELVSIIDINAELNEEGIYTSVYVDDVEFQDAIGWREMALHILEDKKTYPNYIVKAIAKKMQITADKLLESLADGRE